MSEEVCVLTEGFVTGIWSENTYVLAAHPGAECVIIDPGQDCLPRLTEVLARHRLLPTAVVLTHGHLDHVWSLVEVCQIHRIPAYCHEADHWLLRDPLAGFGEGATALAAMVGGVPDVLPADLRALPEQLTLAGLLLDVLHTPGHTPGSCVLTCRSAAGVAARVEPAGAGVVDAVLVSGDLIFAGSIGRTDLPGGNPGAMSASLRLLGSHVADDMPILPGHGPATSMGAERRTNPFLRDLPPARSDSAESR